MKKLLALGLLLATGFLAGCSGSPDTTEPAQPAAGTYATITAQQAKQMMDASDGYVILDVRTEAEYQQGHIANAILIPNTDITAQAPSAIPDKQTVIFVYCRSGVRAQDASQQLAAMGYTHVYDMGGLVNWPYGTVTN